MLQDTKVNAIGKYKTSLTFNGHFLKQFYTYKGKKQSYRLKNQRGSSSFTVIRSIFGFPHILARNNIP